MPVHTVDIHQLRSEVIQELGRLPEQEPGFLSTHASVHFPENLGGQTSGFLKRSIAIEELARSQPGRGATLSAASLGTGLILEGGNETQLRSWLPRLATGEEIMTICMTEPGSGSHLLGMSTTAAKVPGGWIINGAKRYIGNSHIATAHGVIARTDSGNHRRALSAFAIPASTAGVSVGERNDLMGLPGFSIGEVRFTDCFISDEAIVGCEGDGLSLAHRVVSRHGKPNIGSLAIGLHARALDKLVDYSSSRKLYGAPISELPSVDREIATNFANLYTSRLLMYDAVSSLDNGHTNEVGIGIAKLTASSHAVKACLHATTAIGAIGNDRDLGIVQTLLDALMTAAPSGTEDVILKRISEHVKRTPKQDHPATPTLIS